MVTTQSWVAAPKEKSGRSLEEWLALVKKAGPKIEKDRREWLRREHGLGTNAAGWIAERATSPAAGIDAEVKRWLRLAYEEDGG